MGILRKEGNESKYLTLVSTDDSKYTLKNMRNYGAKSEILLDQ